jgi:hypothetical protein
LASIPEKMELLLTALRDTGETPHSAARLLVKSLIVVIDKNLQSEPVWTDLMDELEFVDEESRLIQAWLDDPNWH